MDMKEGKQLFRRVMMAVVMSTVCVSGVAYGADELDAEWESDLEYLVRLGNVRLDLYADMQRQAMTKKYASRKDDLRLANAIYFFAIRKPQEAEKFLSGFGKNHALYTRALYIRGTKYAEIGMYPQAEKNFKAYYQAIPDAPKGKRARKEYVLGLQYYTKVLQEMGRGNEAAALLDKMPPEEGMGEREMAYLKQLSLIEAEENKLEAGRGVNVKALQAADKELRDLFFKRDGISALAAIQVGRIQGILGYAAIMWSKGDKNKIKGIKHFLDAIKIIKQFEDFIAEMEEGNSKSTSPMPEALYYKSIAIRGQAIVTAASGKLDLAGKQLARGAVVYLKMIQRDYRRSPFVNRLPKQYLLCEEVNKQWKLNVDLKLPKIDKDDLGALFQPGDIVLREADNFKNNYNEARKRYDDAAKRYKEVIDKNMSNPAIVNHVANYMRCLAMLDKLDEGKRFLEGLAKKFPEEKDGIGKAALMLGAFANKRMLEWPKGKPNPLKAKQESLYFWARDMFVDNSPGHPQAAAVAYDLAVTRFNEAIRELLSAKKLADGAQKDAALKKANKKLLDVVPFYKRVAEVFPMHPKGKASLMKVGQLYNLTDQKDAAISYFKQFIAADDGSLSKDELLEATYLIGELHFRSGRPLEARENYVKVKEMTDPGKPYANLAKAPLFREIVIAYIPDCIDRESALLTNRIGLLEERRNKLTTDSYDLDVQTRAIEKSLQDFPAKLQEITERTEDLKRILSSFELDYKGAARAQAKAEAEKPNAPKTEQEYYDIFVKGVEDAAHTNVNTEAEAIAARRSVLDTEQKQLDEEKASMASNLAALQKANGKMQETIKEKQAEIKRIEASFAKITKDLDDAIDKRNAMQEVLKTSTDDTEIKKTRDALEAQVALIARLENDKLDIISNSAKQTIVACQRDIQANEGGIADNKWHIESIRGEEALNAIRRNALNEQYKALDARQAFVDKIKDVLAKDEDARLKANAGIKAQGKEIADLLGKAAEQEKATLTKIRDMITASSKKIVARKAEIQKTLSAVSEELKPMDSEWRKQKAEAVAGYREYLRIYPRGKYFASCTTDLAGALVDMEEYREAVSQLKNLVGGRVPECSDAPGNAKCDPEKTVNALYNLAKAQTRAKQNVEAASTYARLMDSKHPGVKKAVGGMAIGNLFFIADQGLNVGAPQAALTACETILARVESSKQVASTLRPSQIERVYVIAAEAALFGKQPEKTLTMVKKLLELNARTALLFDARFLEAEALVDMGKFDEGIGMLNQMVRRATDSALGNRIRCQVAKLYLKSTKAEYRASAMSVYSDIVGFAKESAEMDASWLQSAEAKSNQEWVDTAFVELARLYKAQNASDKLSDLKATYRKLYPNGAKLAELTSIN